MQERLQKIISAAGITSRRKAEELITQGRVSVNGHVLTELGSKADLERDHIKVNGKLLRPVREHVYLLLNKPAGVVSTLSDPQHRPTVISLLHGVQERVYPVGRLDFHSSGLMLLTNDGALANHLMSRATASPRTYHVKLEGAPSPGDIRRLEQGIALDGRRTAPAEIRRLAPSVAERRRPSQRTPGDIAKSGPKSQIQNPKSDKPWYEVTLVEGRYHQVRRMFERIGQQVIKLKRVRMGSLTDQGLAPGRFRHLTTGEVERLKKSQSRKMSSE
ncbi:MAG TPA: pseudouridine synthase [Terriglobia bacterium]|nr:pseudouridine synthase [Terriglobia bacterium]